MTVKELLDAIGSAFPFFTPQMAQTWAPIYKAALGAHEGPRLKRAYEIVMQEFDPTPRKPHPGPKDFLLSIPNIHAALRDDGKKLDFKAHGERCRRLMFEWRETQGNRGAAGNPQIMQALEFIAEPLANVAAWKENPEPLRLTGKQLRIARQRAIAQERVRQYGKLGKDGAEWWRQIEAICNDWGIPAIYEEWAAKKALVPT